MKYFPIAEFLPPDCQKDWFAVFKVKVTVKNNKLKYDFLICYLTADPFATKLGLMVHQHKLDCLVKVLDCSVVIQVKVTEKVQNSCERSFGDISSAAEPSWYGNATSWAKVSCKKMGLLSSSSGSQRGLI